MRIIKAIMLLCGATFMALAVLWQFHFNPELLSPRRLKSTAKHDAIMGPGALIKDPISAISVGMTLMFSGGRSAAHPDAFLYRAERQGGPQVRGLGNDLDRYFYILTFIIGFGAIVLLTQDPASYYVGGELAKGLKGGGNMAAVHLANAVGGNVFLGVSKDPTICLGINRGLSGHRFEKQNVACGDAGLRRCLSGELRFLHVRTVEGLHDQGRGHRRDRRLDQLGRSDHRLGFGLGSGDG
ncbi:hypothetical protein [Propionivibrio sp.]|uniref:sodium:solute symporter family transporter n=1 Tax=Propionivibrio sp. TaxID=2212460 RepID=UPI0025E665B1|nr:hypothetical protein [Propionivibrio sp.]MBK8745729.1 hypothetical protein [Propionivibrio sp.]